MTAIINFFENIFNVIQTIVNFIVSLVEDLVFIVKTLGEFVIKIPSMFGFLPVAVISLLGVAITIVIIYKVVGRD